MDHLFREPVGSGEHTIALTADNVYGMFYLLKTGQATPEIEAKGLSLIRKGKLVNDFCDIIRKPYI